MTKTGKGTVTSAGLSDALSRARVQPDFEHTKPHEDTAFLTVHRTLADGDLYFVNNRNDREEDVEATFRVSGKEPELWYADTGVRTPASFTTTNGRTTRAVAPRAVGRGVRRLPQACRRTQPTAASFE